MGILLLAACSQKPSLQDQPTGPLAAVESKARSTEFVVLIDNSRSILPPEQIIIREATLLLADLADNGDRLSVITFGENARLVTSVQLQNDGDRLAFKNAVRQGVNFNENLSDIRAGLHLLAQDRSRLFPTADAIHAAVLFSDGKLEPRNTPPQDALQQLLADIKGPLADIDLYAVALGDTTSRQPIPGLNPPLTGLDLMPQQVARGPDYFYHARQLEQLPEIAVTILNKTKGISSLGEESGATFRIDNTVRALTLLVRKRPPGAPASSPLPLAQQIQLVPPESPAPADESIYRSSAYQHFDLFIVRQPRTGLWKVERSDGGALTVLSRLFTPVDLRVQARPHYYLNESATVRAWLWDKERNAVAAGDYQLQAHVAATGQLSSSPHYPSLQREAQTGQYYLHAPGPLLDAIGGPRPDRIELELIAKRPDDPWFLRRSATLSLELREPFIDWFQPPEVTRTLLRRTLPLLGRTVEYTFGGRSIPERYATVGFEVPPELSVVVERFDADTGQYVSAFEAPARAVTENNTLVFRMPHDFAEYGDYRYGYRLTGSTATGPFTLQSPWYSFHIQFFWELAAGLGLLLLVVIQLLSQWTAKLKGRIRIDKIGPIPVSIPIPISPCRIIDSQTIRSLDWGGTRFQIRPRRYLFLFKRCCVALVAGQAQLDQYPLVAGKTRCVPAKGTHELSFAHPDGSGVTVTFTLVI